MKVEIKDINETRKQLLVEVSGDEVSRVEKKILKEFLQQANLKKEAGPIEEAEKTINELRDAWSEMLTQNPEHDISGDPGSLSLQS